MEEKREFQQQVEKKSRKKERKNEREQRACARGCVWIDCEVIVEVIRVAEKKTLDSEVGSARIASKRVLRICVGLLCLIRVGWAREL